MCVRPCQHDHLRLPRHREALWPTVQEFPGSEDGAETAEDWTKRHSSLNRLSIRFPVDLLSPALKRNFLVAFSRTGVHPLHPLRFRLHRIHRCLAAKPGASLRCATLVASTTYLERKICCWHEMVQCLNTIILWAYMASNGGARRQGRLGGPVPARFSTCCASGGRGSCHGFARSSSGGGNGSVGGTGSSGALGSSR